MKPSFPQRTIEYFNIWFWKINIIISSQAGQAQSLLVAWLVRPDCLLPYSPGPEIIITPPDGALGLSLSQAGQSSQSRRRRLLNPDKNLTDPSVIIESRKSCLSPHLTWQKDLEDFKSFKMQCQQYHESLNFNFHESKVSFISLLVNRALQSEWGSQFKWNKFLKFYLLSEP